MKKMQRIPSITMACWAILGSAGCSSSVSSEANGDAGPTVIDSPDPDQTNVPGSDEINPVRFDVPEDYSLDLEAPEEDEGFQVETQGVRLEGGEDDEFCEALVVPGDEDDVYYVDNIEMVMSSHYHHIFLAVAPRGSKSEELMVPGERLRCVGGAHMVYGTDLVPIPVPQGEYTETKYPEGTALKLHGGQKISVNYHYLNTSQEDIIAKQKINMRVAEESEGLVGFRQFGFYNQDIHIPAQGSWSTEMVGTFTQDVYVDTLFRHTHRLGGDFEIYFHGGERDGEHIFTSTDYEQDAYFSFPEPVRIEEGQGFRFVCNFRNPTNRPVTFGPTADDEMCMLLGTWWVANPEEEPEVQHRYKF